MEDQSDMDDLVQCPWCIKNCHEVLKKKLEKHFQLLKKNRDPCVKHLTYCAYNSWHKVHKKHLEHHYQHECEDAKRRALEQADTNTLKEAFSGLNFRQDSGNRNEEEESWDVMEEESWDDVGYQTNSNHVRDKRRRVPAILNLAKTDNFYDLLRNKDQLMTLDSTQNKAKECYDKTGNKTDKIRNVVGLYTSHEDRAGNDSCQTRNKGTKSGDSLKLVQDAVEAKVNGDRNSCETMRKKGTKSGDSAKPLEDSEEMKVSEDRNLCQTRKNKDSNNVDAAEPLEDTEEVQATGESAGNSDNIRKKKRKAKKKKNNTTNNNDK